jgi:hypothetical protein
MNKGITVQENDRTGNLDFFAYGLSTGRTVEFNFGSAAQAPCAVYGPKSQNI